MSLLKLNLLHSEIEQLEDQEMFGHPFSLVNISNFGCLLTCDIGKLKKCQFLAADSAQRNITGKTSSKNLKANNQYNDCKNDRDKSSKTVLSKSYGRNNNSKQFKHFKDSDKIIENGLLKLDIRTAEEHKEKKTQDEVQTNKPETEENNINNRIFLIQIKKHYRKSFIFHCVIFYYRNQRDYSL